MLHELLSDPVVVDTVTDPSREGALASWFWGVQEVPDILRRWGSTLPAERVQEILDGENLMNCQLCKYRAQVLGFEDEVGAAQASHHDHVEGVGTGAALVPGGRP